MDARLGKFSQETVAALSYTTHIPHPAKEWFTFALKQCLLDIKYILIKTVRLSLSKPVLLLYRLRQAPPNNRDRQADSIILMSNWCKKTG